jgi:CHAT domain-containing protein
MASNATIANRPNWSSVAVATGEEATLPWLMSQAPVASHLHLACHGSNTLDEDEGSKLWLAGGPNPLPFQRSSTIPLQARVAVASECPSAQFDASGAPDEHVGLTSGLLQAGAACAIVSLGPVDDEATHS